MRWQARGLATAALAGLGAATLWAADFWQTKPFPEWSEKEVQRIVLNSPWARTVEVRLGGPGGMDSGGGGGRRGGRRGGGPVGGVQDASVGSPSGGDDAGRPGGGGGDSERSGLLPALMVVVRCHSALPVKRAVARARFGDAVLTSPEAARMLSRQETQYVWAAAGIPERLLAGLREGARPEATLRVKGRTPVPAERVETDRGQGAATVYMFFPRAGNSIAIEDRELEIRLKLPKLEIKRSFRLKDMVYEGKLEL